MFGYFVYFQNSWERSLLRNWFLFIQGYFWRAQHTDLEVGMHLCLVHLEIGLVWSGPRESPSGRPESPRLDLISEVTERIAGGKSGDV